MEALKEIEDELVKTFPKLSCQLNETSRYLHVWKISSQGLRYIPNFHLIFESYDNDTDFSVKLLSFHGKLLDCLAFKVTSDGAGIMPKNIKNFVTDYTKDYKICQGIRYDCLDTNVKLVEHFNEEIVSRSIHCLYYLNSTDQESQLQCSECQKLINANGGNDSNNFRIKQEANDFDYAHEIFGDESFEEAIVDVKPPPAKQRRKSRKKVNYNLDQGEDQFNSDDIITDPNNLVNIKLEATANHEYDYKDELLGHLENFDHSELANITDQMKEEKPKRKYKKRKKKGETNIENHADNDFVSIVSNKKIKSENGYEETCQICLKEFYSRQTFEEDLLKHRGYFDIDGLVQCPICPNETLSKQSLNSHFSQVHSQEEPTYVCIVCMEIIKGKITNVKKHLLQQHCLKKPCCPDCGKEMGSTRYLILHMELVHAKSCKEGSICCDRCGKMFPSKTLLLKHKQKTVCAAEEWACNLCPKMFDYKHRFRTHLKVHCGLKPYVCPHCNYGSYKAENMLIHARKMHQLKGCKEDFFTNEDILKEQVDFINKHLAEASHK